MPRVRPASRALVFREQIYCEGDSPSMTTQACCATLGEAAKVIAPEILSHKDTHRVRWLCHRAPAHAVRQSQVAPLTFFGGLRNGTTCEFEEETGFRAIGEFVNLGSIKQKSGKIVTAWAFEGDCNPTQLTSNTCEIEWPPRSGHRLEIREVDCGRWFSMNDASEYIREEQRELLRRLSEPA